MFEKLTSRKLWLAIAGIATGIAYMVGVESGEVAGLAAAIVSIVTYIVVEGRVDRANAFDEILIETEVEIEDDEED